MRRLPALAAVLTLTGCGGSTQPSAPPQITVTGVMLVSDVLDVGTVGCEAKRGYEDVREGSGVSVTDPAGTVVGIGRLGPGTGRPGSYDFADCGFDFTVDVPAGLGFYGVEVGHRGVVRFSEADLGEPVQLTIGFS